MLLEHENLRYSALRASDIIHDGMAYEVYDVTDGKDELVLLIFYSDVTNQMTLSTYREDLPLALVENAIREAKVRLPSLLGCRDENNLE